MIKDLYEHIQKARCEAQKRHIKANMIVIDEELAHTEKLIIPNSSFSYLELPPMIFGLEIKYQKNLKNDYESNFVIFESSNKQKSELEELREVVEIFSKHFYLVDCSLGSLGPTFHTLIENKNAIKLTERENELLEKYIKREY